MLNENENNTNAEDTSEEELEETTEETTEEEERADVKFHFLNNDGGSGFAEQKTVTGGTTIEEFLQDENVDSGRFQIRVRTKAESGTKQTLTPTADYEIQSGDFVTAVPLKAGGAR